jgi:methylmalonyl-CoA mutase
MSSAPEKVVNIPSSSKHPLKVRFVTAASLFDGHDAAINIMRRILQSSGAEVIHLGHNRSVAEIVDAAIQEDAHAIALSSYQGGHVEYLKYMVDMLRDRKRPDMRVFAGGGGVIVPAEIRELEAYGVTRIYSPEDGQAMGLQGLIEDMLERCRYDPGEQAPTSLEPLAEHDTSALASLITALENDAVAESLLTQIRQQAGTRPVPVLGITGTGGSGKSSLTDEIIRRFRLDHADRLRIAIVAVDPTRRRTGGSLLGDRIRMNAINHSNIYMRSIATRDSVGEIPDVIGDVIAACKLCQFDLVIVETPGIGQGDAAIVPLVDASLYVMTPEFGAQSQLEKIDMLDFADVTSSIARAPTTPTAMSANRSSATMKPLRSRSRQCRFTARLRRVSTTMAPPRCTRKSSASWPNSGWPSTLRIYPGSRPANPPRVPSSSPPTGCVTWQRLPPRCATTTPTAASRLRSHANASS